MVEAPFSRLPAVRDTDEASGSRTIAARNGPSVLLSQTAPLSVHFNNVSPPPLDENFEPIVPGRSLAGVDVVVMSERAEIARLPATPPLVEFARIPTDIAIRVALVPHNRSARRTYLDSIRLEPTQRARARRCTLDATTAWIDLVFNAHSPPAIVAVYRPSDGDWRLERGAASRAMQMDMLRIRIGPLGRGSYILEPYDLAGPAGDIPVTVTGSERIERQIDFSLR